MTKKIQGQIHPTISEKTYEKIKKIANDRKWKKSFTATQILEDYIDLAIEKYLNK
jgi:hypothetical protein